MKVIARRRSHLRTCVAVAAMGVIVSAVGTATPARAATTQNSSESLVLSSGALSVGALTPGSASATVAFDPSVWAQTYVAQLTYTIVGGP